MNSSESATQSHKNSCSDLKWLETESGGPHLEANISLETSGEGLGQEDNRSLRFWALLNSQRNDLGRREGEHANPWSSPSLWKVDWAPVWVTHSLKKIFFNSKIFTLEYCVHFCHSSTWTSHGYIYVPSLLNPLPPTPLGCHRALCRASCVTQQIATGCLFYIW